MASTVNTLFDAAGVMRLDAVSWRVSVPSDVPGICIVARTPDPAVLVSGPADIDSAAVQQLLDTRAELLMDGQRPSLEGLSERLASMWLPDVPAIYVRLAGTSRRTRIGQFYSTRLGARSPHAGGWLIKCIRDLSTTWVHFGECTDVKAAELKMLDKFMPAVTPEVRAAVLDRELPGHLRTWNSSTRQVVAGSNAAASAAPKRRAEVDPMRGLLVTPMLFDSWRRRPPTVDASGGSRKHRTHAPTPPGR
jgi:hypothetical protein